MNRKIRIEYINEQAPKLSLIKYPFTSIRKGNDSIVFGKYIDKDTFLKKNNTPAEKDSSLLYISITGERVGLYRYDGEEFVKILVFSRGDTIPVSIEKTSYIPVNDGNRGDSRYVEEKELAEVAYSGSYNDLKDVPDILEEVKHEDSVDIKITGKGTDVEKLKAELEISVKTDIQKGVTAEGWGDHSNQGYLKSADISGKEDKSNKVIDLSNPDNITYPTTKAVADALDKFDTEIYGDYDTITSLLDDQPNQSNQKIYYVEDASDDPNLSFAPEETNRQAFYRFDGVASGQIEDYTLISAPYSLGSSSGSETPALQQVLQKSNYAGEMKITGLSEGTQPSDAVIFEQINIDENINPLQTYNTAAGN